MKKLLIIGGYGSLGKSIIHTFKKSPNWKIMNIDFNPNLEADYNYQIKDNLNFEEVTRIDKLDYLNNEKLNCIVNVAGGWRGGSLDNTDIIESVNMMMQSNLFSSVLAAHLGKKFLNKNSLFILTGANIVKTQLNPGMLGYHLSKNSVHHLTDILVIKKILPENTKVFTILPTTIDTTANRNAMPDADFSKWTKPEAIAKLIKDWSDNKNLPEDTFVKV
jgi:NAD(P)-dependent dehydrogenase (short-subunit alcohol dehydrogenase family)